MNKEQQDKLWNELSKEYKDYIRERYLKLRDTVATADCMLIELFGSHNLNPKPLTYEDINAKLYEHKSNIIQFMNTTSIKHEKKINAINKLLEVAKYLNGDWKPDWNNEDNEFYTLGIDPDYNSVKVIEVNMQRVPTELVYFRTKELAEQAIQILGEETIRLALSCDY